MAERKEAGEPLRICEFTTVGEVIDWLKQRDINQRFLTQAILPSGEPWGAPASMGILSESYLYLQIQCHNNKEHRSDSK